MRKKLLPFITVLMLALFVGSCSNEDVMPEIDKGATSRTITFTASMPGEDDPATRVSVAEEADRTIALTWEDNDKLDLLFVQGTNKFNKSTTVTNITDAGKKASFTIVIPEGIIEDESFSLYGVYGGGEVSTTNPELIKLPAIEGTTLNEENVGKKVMLRFAKTVDATGAVGTVNFQHVGFLFTTKIKVTGGTLDDITSVQLVGADAGNETWTYNASENHFNMETGDFTAVGTGSNTVSFQNSEKDAVNNILTVRNWLPATETAWPALKLSINGTNETANAKPSRTPEVGKAYYLYATWDGTDLVFADKDFTVPQTGTKISIADFRAAVANGELYTEDKYIEGEVILNPANQVVNNAVAAISDGTAGITLFFGWDDDVVAAMPLGAKVKVGVKDGKWNVYNGLVQFEVNVAKVEIIEETATTPLEPRVATVQDILDGKYQSDLVQISDVQFKGVPATYSGNNALVNSASDEVNVYTRNQATFADDNVPEGNGLFIGVVNHFNNPQLAIRKVDDLAGMTGDRFDDEGGTDPQPGEGDGTKENPYTVTQAFAKQDGSKAWVRGYIVGWKKGSGYNVEFSVENGSASNIAIADSKDETDGTKVIGVQLTNNKPARTDLNLASNPDMYKVEVLLFGNLEPYFTPDEGLKNVEEYVLIEDGDIPVIIDFSVDKSAVVFNADSELTSTVKLTTDAAQAWTAASDASWLTVAPASGSGNTDVVLTAEANAAETARTAKVTFSPTANTDLTPIVVTVTQAGAGTPPPTSNLLFPGSDFNVWNTFTSSLNVGVNFATESLNGGIGGSGALLIEGTQKDNLHVFTAKVPAGFSAAGKTKITFWIKGSAATKALSLNVYTTNTAYKCYNLPKGTTSDLELDPTAQNSYAGNINTGGEWIKVTLDISTIAGQINTTEGQNLFGLKIGKDAVYDILVDDITIE